ncbi:MAG: hypothetical protein L6R40_005411 [Gallowayella cf. fulva]|nr:MAG: hypothetical protein L6R40_005411 [Xanthomendoza cf. fulva]
MESPQAPVPKTAMPLLGRSKVTPRMTGKSIASPGGRASDKPNSSILSFFKKTQTSSAKEGLKQEEESLFIDDGEAEVEVEGLTQTPTPPGDFESENDLYKSRAHATPMDDSFRHNEISGSNKRRRLSTESDLFAPSKVPKPGVHITSDPLADKPDDKNNPSSPIKTEPAATPKQPSFALQCDTDIAVAHAKQEAALKGSGCTRAESPAAIPSVPTLKREPTSRAEGLEYNEGDDFIDDEYTEGEEYMERRWMEEQAELEVGLEDDDEQGGVPLEIAKQEDQMGDSGADRAQTAATCPICEGSFGNMSEQDASKHVNDCLDGKASALLKPGALANIVKPTELKQEVPNHKRFQRAAIAKPGQENPFGLAAGEAGGSSAFSRLMSGHAEDAAWAMAAATEASSRGKPAYQRTCPFYKILPGFSICVDAFRYGAVEGCKAYFLSHFHSDHYIGLTSSWCHGPIYCSRVTGNLVRRQLRVDPKWVIDLEFDEKIEVPGTQGVNVTMIPANHCPGSSLYLYEKVMGKGKNPKMQRVLHCGDFRACPTHVQHPLLRPDVIDRVTGKTTAQQKLDVCYLDTTYLTPKYAFPSQEEVIKACADMCVSLSKDKVDENDDWEQTKKERAGSGMVNFVRKDSKMIKEEADDEDTVSKGDGKRRGRLLVIVGTYSIGKERICLGVAKALNSKIYATSNKQKICAALEDPELMARLTNDPLEAQVHMQMLMEIRAETLADYLTGYKPHFSRIVGFRPSGWNYRPPNSRFTESPSVQTVLHSENWKSRYSMAELVPQRGSTREAHCFGVPYSEHSSFRELSMFCCALRIDKIIPTVNVGSAKSREKMKGWCEKWAMEKKKNGLFKVADGQTAWS